MLNGHTRTCGLIGNPVAHTRSPLIQNHMARVLGQNLAYLPFPVAHGDLGAAVRGALALDFLGLNVTVPYKSEVIAHLAQIDPLAERIGAVNTLVRCPGGFKGYNTDMPGLYRAMRQDGVEAAGRDVVILGAGGVARAVAVMLLDRGGCGGTYFEPHWGQGGGSGGGSQQNGGASLCLGLWAGGLQADSGGGMAGDPGHQCRHASPCGGRAHRGSGILPAGGDRV